MRADGYLLSRRATLTATCTGRYRWALIAGPVMGAGFVLLSSMDAASGRALATAAMIVTGLGLGLLIQNLSLAVQNGVSVMGSILASGMPASGPAQLAHAIHPVFVIGIPLTALTLALVLAIPELPLRRTVREVPA